MSGFVGKILRVDLSKGSWDEELPRDLAKKFMGGAGLATKYLYDEVARESIP